MDIREKIIAEMERRKWTYSQLGLEAKVQPQTVKCYLNGTQSCVEIVGKLAAALGMKLVLRKVKK